MATPTQTLAARSAGVPFYVVAPTSTLDPDTAAGAEIEIEQRDPDEVTRFAGRRTAAHPAAGFNPAFDVTPHQLVAGYITERGVLQPPFTAPRAASATG